MRDLSEEGILLSREVKTLFLAAMGIFVITVVIGILNGLDLIEFERQVLLTHVHAGTLGWITLSVIGASLWLFSQGSPMPAWQASWARWMSYGAMGAILLYVLAFFIGNLTLRPIAGTLAFLAITAFFLWLIVRLRSVPLTIPRLAMLAAAASLTIGAIFGVLIGLKLAGYADFVPESAFGAHPATLVIGYLLLAGMAINEWHLQPSPQPTRLSRWGVAQVGFLFLGGLTLMVGVLLDFFILILLNVPFEVLGIIIYLTRLGPRLVRLSWLKGSGERLFGLSSLFLVVNVGLLAYLIASYADRFEEVPPWMLFALDHSVFIGVMTNGLLGLAWVASQGRRSLWSWVDHVPFWGINIGLVGFVVGLMLQEAVLKQTFTPIMGASILLTLLIYALRLRASSPGAAPARLAQQ